MAISTGSFARLLKPGVLAVLGMAYKQHPASYPLIFEKRLSQYNFEEDVVGSAFGLAQVRHQGGSALMDDHSQAWVQKYVHVEYAKAFAVTKLHIEDNKAPQIVKDRTIMMHNSLLQTKENVAANIFNRAFNSSYTYADGVEFISTSCRLPKGGTFSNKIATNADLSETSLEQMLIQAADFVYDENMRMATKVKSLLIPNALMFEAERITKSPLRVSTADNDLNAMKSLGLLSEGCIVNPYLTDPDAFFLLTDCPQGLSYFEKNPIEITTDTEFLSDNMLVKATERYCFGASDKHCVLGSPGA